VEWASGLRRCGGWGRAKEAEVSMSNQRSVRLPSIGASARLKRTWSSLQG
jgi:hypothetical protein